MTDAARLCSQAERPKVIHTAVATSPLKRAFDVAVSASGLLFLAPLLLLVALAIRAESAGPVLCRQRRAGLNGETFILLRFRTMRALDGDLGLSRLSGDEGRISRLGAFLRKSGICELPQLLNVLRGDMSLVGPRPHAPAYDQHSSARIPGYRDRFRARPGLTGLAQVSDLRRGSHRPYGMAQGISADVAYVEDWSFRLDLRIILATMLLIAHDRTAY